MFGHQMMKPNWGNLVFGFILIFEEKVRQISFINFNRIQEQEGLKVTILKSQGGTLSYCRWSQAQRIKRYICHGFIVYLSFYKIIIS